MRQVKDERRATVIVERRTYPINPGCEQDMVNLIKEEMEALGGNVVYRIYHNPLAGPLDVVVHEMQFQDMAEHDKFWTRWLETRATPAFWEKWYKLYRLGGHVEFWGVAE
jgi:hypothetical protein